MSASGSLYSPRPFIGRFAFASLPSASVFALGTQADVSNVALAGSSWVTDGTLWRPVNGHVTLAITAIPMILPSSGSIANNGALTLTTALDKTYTACYLYFPANAIAAGVAAGFYYVVMSSTTVGVIYNNLYSSGLPAIPSSPTAFATTGPLAYVQTTAADITCLSIAVIGGIMGINGGLRATQSLGYGSSATAKTAKHFLGGSQFRQIGNSTIGNLSAAVTNTVWNAGSAILQNSPALVNTGATLGLANGNQWVAGPNTAVDQNYTVTLQIAAVTDYLISHGFTLELLRP